MTIGVAHFGSNGHTVIAKLKAHPRARLAAVAAMNEQHAAAAREMGAKVYDSFDQLLADPEAQLVVLCSPRRADQAQHALAALQAGKHVYAEKPAAMTQADLDRLVAAARDNGKIFHEMAGTVFAQPYLALRRIVLDGLIGQVTQVYAQKSYPYHDRRPRDENIDGGLVLQVGVHAFRMIEHVTGLKITGVQARQSQVGCPEPVGDLRTTSAFLLTLSNGALGAAIANYFNPNKGTGVWGYEGVRVFGTLGLVEANPGGKTSRLVIGETDHGPLDLSEPSLDYFDLILDEIIDGKAMPISLEDELHPTRMVIAARAAALAAER